MPAKGWPVGKEVELQRAVLARLKLVPESAWWRNCQMGRTFRAGLGPGSADIIGCYRGRFVAIEIKGPKGTVNDEQTHWMANVFAVGGITAVVKSMADLEALLSALSKRVTWNNTHLQSAPGQGAPTPPPAAASTQIGDGQ